MNTKTPECYTTDSQARCLRVETDAIGLLVLPLDQFVYAQLRLVFATHEVLISVHVLQRVATAIHRLELSGIVKLPEKYHSLLSENQPRIQEIVATENNPSTSQS